MAIPGSLKLHAAYTVFLAFRGAPWRTWETSPRKTHPFMDTQTLAKFSEGLLVLWESLKVPETPALGPGCSGGGERRSGKGRGLLSQLLWSHSTFRNRLPPPLMGSQGDHTVILFPLRSREGLGIHHSWSSSSEAPQGQGQSASLSRWWLVKREPGRSSHLPPPN